MGSDDEDTETKLIIHAADVTARGAASTMICSPDTYVLVLAVRRYPELWRIQRLSQEERVEPFSSVLSMKH